MYSFAGTFTPPPTSNTIHKNHKPKTQYVCHPSKPAWYAHHGNLGGDTSTETTTQPRTQGVESLLSGTRFKLTCGVNTHDVLTLRILCHVFTAAGADCFDVAAVIAAAR